MSYWGKFPVVPERAALTGQLSHAYLFTGPEGIGKKTVAREFAARILCEGEAKPCGSCKQCAMLAAGSHPDFILVEREKDKATLSVRLIREMIDEVYVKPLQSPYKIFLLPEADKMDFSGQNALLKVFEEPPSYCVILLVAKNEQSLLPTVRSRAVTVRIPYIPETVIEKRIAARFPLQAENASFLAAFSGGIPGRAIAMCEDEEFLQLRAAWLTELVTLIEGKRRAVFSLAELFEKNKDRQELLFELLLSWLKDALLTARELHEGIINKDRQAALDKTAGCIPERNLAAAFTYLTGERTKMGRYANTRLWITDVLLSTREVLHDESNRNML